MKKLLYILSIMVGGQLLLTDWTLRRLNRIEAYLNDLDQRESFFGSDAAELEYCRRRLESIAAKSDIYHQDRARLLLGRTMIAQSLVFQEGLEASV